MDRTKKDLNKQLKLNTFWESKEDLNQWSHLIAVRAMVTPHLTCLSMTTQPLPEERLVQQRRFWFNV